MDIYNVDLDDNSFVKSEDYDNWVAPTKAEVLSWDATKLNQYFDKLKADYDLLSRVETESYDPVMAEAAAEIVERIYPTYAMIDSLLFDREQVGVYKKMTDVLDALNNLNRQALEQFRYTDDDQVAIHVAIRELIKARKMMIEQQIKKLEDGINA